MTSSVIQLFAANEEFAKFAGEVALQHNLYLVLHNFLPTYRCELINDPSQLTDHMDFNVNQWVTLSVRSPDLLALNQLEFFDRNIGLISFHFGRLLPSGLDESSMGYKTDDEETIAVGKAIGKRLKKITKTGVFITNPAGLTAYSKHLRYTEGALALERSGVQIRALGGNLARLEQA